MARTTIEPKHIGLVIERALGHVTHAENLRHWVNQDPGLVPHWLMIPHEAEDIWHRLGALPFSVRLSLRARGVVHQAMRHQRLDSAYFHTQGLSLFSLRFMRRVPTLISLDATPVNFGAIAAAYDATPSTGMASRIKTAWFRHAFSLARGLVAMSNWVKMSLVQDYAVAPDKIRVIPIGVDLRQWRFAPRAPAPGRRMRLLFVGGDFERKGGLQLLDAFKHGLAEFCELDIVTTRPPTDARERVRIHTGLTPNCPALRKLYQDADLFVLPTRGDATPNAIIEAMASGLPVVTTRVGAIGELVEEGVTGHFLAAADAREIIEVVGFLARHRGTLPAMGQAARTMVEQNFNAETNSKRIIAFLKEISRSQAARKSHR